ncbi:hypothetical protein ACEXQB_008895 [Herbiconiux sp. P18]|uniref:hypothetical protein n=1 Tax=Herbiconiux liangxiaofengii TaxID=3342795 RepID=UPI0035B9AAED
MLTLVQKAEPGIRLLAKLIIRFLTSHWRDPASSGGRHATNGATARCAIAFNYPTPALSPESALWRSMRWCRASGRARVVGQVGAAVSGADAAEPGTVVAGEAGGTFGEDACTFPDAGALGRGDEHVDYRRAGSKVSRPACCGLGGWVPTTLHGCWQLASMTRNKWSKLTCVGDGFDRADC